MSELPAMAPETPDRPTIRILVVEDSLDDYELLKQWLRVAPFDVDSTRVEDEPAMSAALRSHPWDLVVSDHHLPRFSSTEALATLRSHGGDVPFIILSGMIGEDAAVEAMHAGADDYVMKSNMRRLIPAIERSLRMAGDRRAKRAAEAAERAAAQELRVSRERLSALAAHMESSKETERAAIAREIHDEMGGLLTGLKADVAWLRKHAPEGDPRFREKLVDIEKLLDEVVQVSKRIARSLRPAILDQGLNAALEWQAREFEKHAGIPCRFRSNDEDLALDAGQATGVFRVFQEALTNVAKHSHAKRVDVQVFATDKLVTLEVHDDGVGIDAKDLAKPESFGVRGMQERVEHLGGWLDVSGAPGRGTTLMLSIPRGEAGDADPPA
jgi:signal transduction histidine kinase